MYKRIIAQFLIIGFVLASAGGLFAQGDNIGQEVLSLEACIAQALNTHPKISIYSYKTDQKKEKLRSVTAEYLPQVDAVASYDRLSYVPQAKQRFLGKSNDDYQTDIVVTQPLYPADIVIYLDFENNNGKMSTNRKCPLNSGHLDIVDIYLRSYKNEYIIE